MGHIVHIEKPDMIYCQLERHKAETDQLYEAMSTFYHAAKGLPVETVEEGMCYIVQFATDNEWYRALVKSINGPQIQVLHHTYWVSIVRALSSLHICDSKLVYHIVLQ